MVERLSERLDVMEHRAQQRNRRDDGARPRLAHQVLEPVNDCTERAMLIADDRSGSQNRRERGVAFDGRHQDGYRRVLQHFLRLRAEHQALDAAASVRCHEDQVAAAASAASRIASCGRSLVTVNES
jgi:hypothetical protein